MKTTTVKSIASAAIVILAFGLAGCTGQTDPSSTSSDSALKYTNMDDWEAAWQTCMRKNGAKLGADGLAEEGQDITVFNEAVAVCEDETGEMPNGGLKASPEEQLKAWTVTAECLRDRGYDIPDPKHEASGAWSLATPRDLDEGDWNDCASLGWGVSPDEDE
jgi:hypothetical protein